MKQVVLGALGLVVIWTWCSKADDAPKPRDVKDAAKAMTLPPGFQATLFAGEPDITQPIAFTFDDRGRMWVVECHSYPKWQKDPTVGKDRVIILEDADGDGTFDKRTVVADNLSNVSGIEYGFGGIWLCSTPNLVFLPIQNDRPTGPPQILLDGWNLDRAQHNVFNSLIWGPDGWLYGCNGILSDSFVGKPGSKDADRTRLNCGVWRYHPTRHVFETVASGTTNPWGLDFDEHGEMFITNCVIEHLWHVVPGGHYERMFGEDLTPNVYRLMKSGVDHIHWAGGPWYGSRGGVGSHSDAGGGHAHSGAMIYLGDNWPARYRNGALTCNIHGNRVNHDVLERRGSSYVFRHAKDFLFANDTWFRGLVVKTGPDGAAYISDWCDTGECHNYVIAEKTNGRVYKVFHGKTQRLGLDFAALNEVELVEQLSHKNDWRVRQARRVLQERAGAGKVEKTTVKSLRTMLTSHAEGNKRLRALWALHALGQTDDALLVQTSRQPHEAVRAWTVRLALENKKPSVGIMDRLIAMAQSDPSALVRLHLAAGLQRLPTSDKVRLARPLLQHPADADDAYIPLMLWYGIEPLVTSDRAAALELLAACDVGLVREFLARRLVAEDPTGEGLDAVLQVIENHDAALRHRDLLRGMSEALLGRKELKIPPRWPRVAASLMESPLPEVRDRALALAAQFGDPAALTTLHGLLHDKKQPAATRRYALTILLRHPMPKLAKTLQTLLDDVDVRGAAARGLASMPSEHTAKLLLEKMPSWSADEQADALQTLASNTKMGLALLDAVESQKLARNRIDAFTVRQLLNLKSKEVNARVEKVWGSVRIPSKEKAATLAKYKAELGPDKLKTASAANGRALYAKHCGICHKLYGEGGDVGPELTGSQRHNLDYLLDNVLDPNAILPREYYMVVVTTQAGRVITGIVKRETETALVLRTQNEEVVISKADIDSRTSSNVSLMPEGIFQGLRIEEVRDLVAYLTSTRQP